MTWGESMWETLCIGIVSTRVSIGSERARDNFLLGYFVQPRRIKSVDAFP
jgi:hypothetical protein